MTKPEILALLLSGAALLAGLFAAFESHRSAGSIASLEQKLAVLESSAAAPAGSSVPAGPSNAEIARELSALRSRIASLTAQPPGGTANPGVQEPSKGAPFVMGPEAKADAERREQDLAESMTKGVMSTLVERIGLTDQQGMQVRAVVFGQVAGWQKKRKTITDAGMKDAFEEYLKDTNEKIKVCLTQEQQAKYDDLTKGPNGLFGVSALGSTINPPYQPPYQMDNPR